MIFIDNSYRFSNPLLVDLVQYSNLVSDSIATVGQNGTDTSVSYGSHGDFQNSADLTASTSSNINLGDSDNFSFGDGSTNSDFTIHIRFAHNVAPNADFLLGKRDASTNREYQLSYVTGGTRLRWREFDQSTGGTRDIEYILSPSTSTFYSVTIVNLSGTLYMYIDGVDTGNSESTSGTYVAMENSTADLILGKYSASTSFSLNGYLGELAIWKRGLSALEVASISQPLI